MEVVAGRERLGLEGRHVHTEGALALAGLALQAQIEDLVQAVVAERRLRVRRRKGQHQRVGPSPGGVLLVTGGHVGGAHDPAGCLAAQPDVHAAVGGGTHAVGEAEPGRQGRCRSQGRVAKMLGHGRRVDDLAGVHAPVRVEQTLDLPHRLVQLVAEHAAVELAPGQTVAVLARVGPAVLGDQVEHLLGHGSHRAHLRRAGEVEERAHVQAADRAVPVEPGAQAVAVEDPGQARGVGGQVGRVDRRVLDERERAASTGARRHEQPEAGRADPEHVGLLGGGDRSQDVVAVPAAPPARREPVQPGGHLRFAVTEEGDEQQRLGVTLERRGERGVLQPLAGQVKDRPVHQLDRRRLAGERGAGCLDRGLGGAEVPDGDRPVPGRRHQPHQRLGHRHERPLRADHEPGQVERPVAGQPVEPVAAGPPPPGREAGRDRVAVPFHQAGQPPVDGALQAGPTCPPGQLLGVERLQSRPAPVGEDHVEAEHVVDGHAVADRVAAGRVVADHPAERRPVRRRGVGPEEEAVPGGGPVQVVLHHTGLDAGAAAFGVDLQDGPQMARAVQHDRASHRLAGQAGARPAWQDRHPELGGDRDRRGDVVGVAGEDHPERLDRVHAGVPGEHLPRPGVEADLPTHGTAERGRQLGRPGARHDGHRPLPAPGPAR
jgi:hypothetical protein